MGNFRSDNGGGGGFRGNRSGGRSGGFGGGRSGGRGGFRDRDSGTFERRRPEMHDVICDKCGKECQVPFKPSGDKPVLCSDCFRKEGDSGSGRSRGSSQLASGISQEQFREINTKLDKILGILEMIEFEGEDESEKGEAEESKDSEEAEEKTETSA